MIKKLWLPVLFLVCVLFVFPQEDKPIITVLDFDTSEVSQAEMRAIISLLSSSLFKTDYFTVIDVSQRDTVLKEMEFSMAGCSDESCMLEIGKLLSAEAIVVGSISRVGTKFVFSAKMLETETARTLSTADGIYPDLDTLLEDIFTVTAELAGPYTAQAAAWSPAEPEPAAEPVPEAEPETREETAEAEKPEKPPKPVREPRPPREPGEVNIPAIATLAGGAASLGTGAYFLIVSLPLVMEYFSTKKAYDEAADLSVDVTALWNAYEAARAAAVEGNASTNLIIGGSLAGAGIALGAVSAILFLATPAADEPAVSAAFLPFPGGAALACRVRY